MAQMTLCAESFTETRSAVLLAPCRPMGINFGQHRVSRLSGHQKIFLFFLFSQHFESIRSRLSGYFSITPFHLSFVCSLVPTGAGADVWRTHAIVAPGTGGQAGPPLSHPIQLQVEEEARFTGQAAIRGRACRTTCRTESAHGGAPCG